MGSDPNISMHELVREVLKQDNDFSDYYLNNTNNQEGKSIKPDVQENPPSKPENISQAQERLEVSLKRNQIKSQITQYDKKPLSRDE